MSEPSFNLDRFLSNDGNTGCYVKAVQRGANVPPSCAATEGGALDRLPAREWLGVTSSTAGPFGSFEFVLALLSYPFSVKSSAIPFPTTSRINLTGHTMPSWASNWSWLAMRPE